MLQNIMPIPRRWNPSLVTSATTANMLQASPRLLLTLEIGTRIVDPCSTGGKLSSDNFLLILFACCYRSIYNKIKMKKHVHNSQT
jgi:hypothetical protein